MSVMGWRSEAERLEQLENENLALRKHLADLHRAVIEAQRLASPAVLQQAVQEALGTERAVLEQLIADAAKALRTIVSAGLVRNEDLP